MKISSPGVKMTVDMVVVVDVIIYVNDETRPRGPI